MQMRHAVLEQKRRRVSERVSEAATLAALQRLRWDLSERGCASSGFHDFPEGGGVCLVLQARVHVCVLLVCALSWS